MTTSLRDDVASNEQTRPGIQTFREGDFECDASAATIANGGEASSKDFVGKVWLAKKSSVGILVQGILYLEKRSQKRPTIHVKRLYSGVSHLQTFLTRRGSQVDVTVNQPRKNKPAVEIDDRCISVSHGETLVRWR